MGTFFEALLSAHYHTAKLRAEYEARYPDASSPVRKAERGASHEEFVVSHQAWRKLVDRLGEGGPLLSRILSPDNAMKVLRDHYQRYTRDKDRDRLSSYDGAPRTPHDHAPSRHSTAMWGLYHWLCVKCNRSSGDVEAHIVNEKFGGPFYARIAGGAGDDPDQVFFEFFKSLLPQQPPENFQAPPSWQALLQSMKFEMLESAYDEATRVTKIRARVTHLAPKNKTVDKIADETDPRNWSRNFPQIFAKAYAVQDDRPGLDRLQDPDPDPKYADGNPKEFVGVLFEDAAIEFDLVRLLRGRTLLNINFQVTEDPPKDPVRYGKASCVFSLREALTNSVYWLSSPSGPDVDDGPDGILQARLFDDDDPKNAAAPARLVESTAGKHLRFSTECYYSDEQNAFALPMWKLSIIAGLVRSVTM